MSPLVCLTLLVPPQAQDLLVDSLLAHAGPAAEFSLHPVDARGPLVRLSAGDEQVQGFARRIQAQLILPAADSAALLARLRPVLAGVPGGYWLTAVQDFAAFDAASVPGGAA